MFQNGDGGLQSHPPFFNQISTLHNFFCPNFCADNAPQVGNSRETHVWITKYVLRRILNMAPSDFSIRPCLVNLFVDITAKGFGKPHTNFGVF